MIANWRVIMRIVIAHKRVLLRVYHAVQQC
jgi:hypothetical protein